MRKTLSILLVVLIGLCMITSCNPESKLTEELVSVELVTGQSKALTATLDFDISSITTWKYTAVKNENDHGLATNATTSTGESYAVALNKNEKTGGYYTKNLSQGYWDFELFGYKKLQESDSQESLVCYGKVDNVLITLDKHTVSISVTPQQTEDGKGTIVISKDVTILDAEKGSTFEDKNSAYTKVVTVYNAATGAIVKAEAVLGSDSDLSYGEMSSQNTYKVVVSFVGDYGTATRYTAATATKYINVYDNLTTTVSGSITESVTETVINATVGSDFSAEAKIAASLFSKIEDKTINRETKKVKTNAAPITITSAANLVDNGETVEVKEAGTTFPAGSLVNNATSTEDAKEATLTMQSKNLLKTTTTETTGTSTTTATLDEGYATYEVKGSNGVPAATIEFKLEGATLDPNLSSSNKDNAPTGYQYIEPNLGASFDLTDDNNNDDTVTLTIAYLGGGATEGDNQKPELLKYVKETGYLEYRVYHYSTYVIFANKLALDSKGNLYDSFDDVIEKAEDGSTIILWKDATLTKNITTNKNLTLDLRGRTVTADGSAQIIVESGTITVKDSKDNKVDNGQISCIVGIYTADGVNNKYTRAEAKIGTTLYATVADAIDAVNKAEGETTTVTLLLDSTLDKDIEVSKSFTLDMNSKTITASGGLLVVGTDATLTVSGSADGQTSFVQGVNDQASGTNGAYTVAVAKVTSENSNISYYASITDAAKNATDNDTVILLQNDDLTGTGGSEMIHFLNSGTINLGANRICYGGIQVGSDSSGDSKIKVTLEGAATEEKYNVEAKYRLEESGAMNQFAAVAVWKPTTTIRSGRYYGLQALLVQCQGVYEDATLVIDGGEFVSSNVTLRQVNGKTEINNGKFDAQNYILFAIEQGDSKQQTKITINDGSFDAGNNGCLIFALDHKDWAVEINGGTFTYEWLWCSNDDVNIGVDQLVIKGGTFSTDPSNFTPYVEEGSCAGDPISYVAAGYEAVNNNNGTWTVQPKQTSD